MKTKSRFMLTKTTKKFYKQNFSFAVLALSLSFVDLVFPDYTELQGQLSASCCQTIRMLTVWLIVHSLT